MVWCRRGTMLFSKVIYPISSSNRPNKINWLVTAVKSLKQLLKLMYKSLTCFQSNLKMKVIIFQHIYPGRIITLEFMTLLYRERIILVCHYSLFVSDFILIDSVLSSTQTELIAYWLSIIHFHKYIHTCFTRRLWWFWTHSYVYIATLDKIWRPKICIM